LSTFAYGFFGGVIVGLTFGWISFQLTKGSNMVGDPTPVGPRDPMPDPPAELVTDGLDKKILIQAVVSVVVFALAKYGIELDADVSGALAVVIGFLTSTQGPIAKLKRKGT
jgi:hypothetical protein